MKGFDNKYKSFPDFILKIKKQIWEGKDVNSIANFYTNDIPVRSPFCVTYGNKPVIDATFKTLKEFPNRQLLGEDVIWNGKDGEGYHSSHRILSKGTHLGEGYYGKPTGKNIYYRVIADCACKDNQVYDEWIVRDQGAMVRQIGFTPKEFAQKIIEKKLSVRQSENFVKIFKKKKGFFTKSNDPNIQNLERSISDKIGLNVSIKNNKKNKGTITFGYHDIDQLNKIIDIIKSNY